MVPSVMIEDPELLAKRQRSADVEVDERQVIGERDLRTCRGQHPDEGHEIGEPDSSERGGSEDTLESQASGTSPVPRPDLLVHALMVGREPSADRAGGLGAGSRARFRTVTGLDQSTALEVATPDGGAPGWRRFTLAVVLGAAVAAIPLAFVLFDLWSGGISLTRAVQPSKFYTFQAQAMLHGHLWVRPGSIGIEGFVIHHKTFTYFGIFPSLLRMPFLVVAPHLAPSVFTAPMMAVAWVLTGTMSGLLLWRVRILARGPAPVSQLEAATAGAWMATVLGGSVLLFLSATPWVFSEDIVWSVALAIGAAFLLLGVLESPSLGRVTAAGLVVIAADLNRVTTGVAAITGALLVGAWLCLTRGERRDRRCGGALIGAGVLAGLLGAAVNQVKFGMLFGLPMADHVWTHLNIHRQQFLAAHGGQETGLAFLPSTLLAYLQPFGLRINGTFPFVWLPGHPAAQLGGVLFDQTYPTASIPASMPLLTALGVVGVVIALRSRGDRGLALVRLPLLALAVACAAIFFWGYIATRYLGDFLPFLVLASAVGLVGLVAWLDGRSRRIRIAWGAGIGVLAVVSMAINASLASSPGQDWTPTQASRFVSAQRSLSITPLSSTIHVVDRLPRYAPVGALYATPSCDGLYLSNGTDVSSIPGKALQHAEMQPVERSDAILHTLTLHFNAPLSRAPRRIPLVSWDATTLVARVVDRFGFTLVLEHPSRPDITWPGPTGGWTAATRGVTYHLTVATDPNLHALTVYWHGTTARATPLIMIDHVLLGDGPAITHPTRGPVVVTAAGGGSAMSLCRSLVHG